MKSYSIGDFAVEKLKHNKDKNNQRYGTKKVSLIVPATSPMEELSYLKE